ncbi:MAG: homoserine O-acetyltransferase [Desulfovibrio sp.]|nr:homoserine O-acetyltransferase [Desulfovibrio sp.]MCA1985100.1 homoserine O-acetyltransferase [Desulfovibrio sp.]
MSEYIDAIADANTVGIVEKQFFTFADAHTPFLLESGQQLPSVTLAYETYGRLTPEGDNAVLICHALTGDAHVAGYHDPAKGGSGKPGWWELMVGPGKPIDTDRYFVICSNVLGSCMGSTGPASHNPDGSGLYGLDFPVVTIGDMVKAQRELIAHLKIPRLLAVVGGSMGGMQVLDWSCRYPELVYAAIPLATTARHSALNIAFHEVARQAIMADPNWNRGRYTPASKPATGLAVARMIGHITYLSDEAMRRKFGRRLQDRDAFSFDFDLDLPDFQVESYLRYQGRKFVERFDANSFLYITKAADYFDLAAQHGQGSLAGAMSRARARFLVISFSSDWLYPTYRSRELVQAMKKAGRDVSFMEIDADFGHDAFLLQNERLSALIANFLDHSQAKLRMEAGHAV